MSWKFPIPCTTWARSTGVRSGRRSSVSPGPYTPIPGGKRDAFFQVHKRVQVPYLEDPNTGEGLFESARILKYLDAHYGN
uniref:glutathione S-transferase N-terminal domain-containing protein n=1 Tax=Marinobacter salsuginis TaxID=418719 RepID=UPI002B1BE11D|nr:glutathione S-transferase N-terminal domain-containing protein [Marinobacter salsuginis]